MGKMFSLSFAAMLGVLVCGISGCTQDTEKVDAKPIERESCTLKVSACNGDCHKANTLKECPQCCFENGRLCDSGGSYSFYSCQNLD